MSKTKNIRTKELCDCGRYIDLNSGNTDTWICNEKTEDGGYRYFKVDKRDIPPIVCPYCTSTNIEKY